MRSWLHTPAPIRTGTHLPDRRRASQARRVSQAIAFCTRPSASEAAPPVRPGYLARREIARRGARRLGNLRVPRPRSSGAGAARRAGPGRWRARRRSGPAGADQLGHAIRPFAGPVTASVSACDRPRSLRHPRRVGYFRATLPLVTRRCAAWISPSAGSAPDGAHLRRHGGRCDDRGLNAREALLPEGERRDTIDDQVARAWILGSGLTIVRGDWEGGPG